MANFQQYSAGQLGYKALRHISCLRAGQTVPPDIATDILSELGDMVDAWQIDRRKVFAVTPTLYNLTAGIQAYWVGPGAASEPGTLYGLATAPLVGLRPTHIEQANLLINTVSPIVRKPMQILLTETWSYIAVQGIPFALPLEIWYDRNFTTLGDGAFLLWPGPLSSYQLEVFDTQNIGQLLAFSNLTNVYSFPPGYAEAITLNLAVKVAPQMVPYFKAAPDMEEVRRLANRALYNIESYNAPENLMMGDEAFRSSGEKGAFNYSIGTTGTRTR